MNTAHLKLERIITALLILAAVLFIACSAAAAVSVTADTAGLTGKTGDTVRVPVTVSGLAEIGAYQMIVGIKDDENAKIEVDTATLKGASSDANGLIMYSDADLDGTKPLFELLVTPKSAGNVDIELSKVRIYTTDLKNARAEVISSTLAVAGTGSGKVINDENDGTTVSSGSSDTSGTFETGSKEGVTEVKTDGHANEPVAVYKETKSSQAQYSGGIGDDDDEPSDVSDTAIAPAGVSYFFSNKVYTSTTGGEPYQITMALARDKLDKTGKTTDDLFILHQADGTWYKVPITKIETAADGFVKIKCTAWSSGNYVLAYDAGGQTFPTENAAVSYEPAAAPEATLSSANQNTNPQPTTSAPAAVTPAPAPTASSDSLDITKPPLLYVLIGGGAAVLAAIIIIIVVVSRKRRRC